MNEFIYAVWLLPAVFMFHDFEEIIFLQPWLQCKNPLLKAHFPRLAGQIDRSANRSTSAFAFVVAAEFAVLTAIVVVTVWHAWYALWFAAFLAFFTHLIMHIGQSIVLRGYVPAVATSLLCMPYCVWVLTLVVRLKMFSFAAAIVLAAVGIGSGVLLLLGGFMLADRLDKRLSKYGHRTGGNAPAVSTSVEDQCNGKK